MKSHITHGGSRARSLLMGTTILAGAIAAAAPAVAQDAMETVVVTGYRASLESSTNAKRASLNFSDSVFAEDIGKFPDTNVAEAFNRIPGITITRENDGSGVRVAIRGLDTNHVKVTLNGSYVLTPSTGQTGAGGNNRETDLNIFPIELFTQLTVNKTATADQLEGGASGVINMRSLRPFDNPGTHISYNIQATDFENNGNPGERGTLIGSWTDGPFGVLVGVSGQVNRFTVNAYEGASNSVTTPNLSAVMYYTPAQLAAGATCTPITLTAVGTNKTASANSCNTIGGNTDWNPPATFPAGVGVPAAYVGLPINRANLLALNPGATIDQISNATVPRTGGPGFEDGSRKRYDAIVSLEYRPSDDLRFYFDGIFGRADNNMDRSRVFWIARSGASIPMNMVVDANNVLISGDMANAGISLENQPYWEKTDYFSLNPGMDWQVTDMLHVDANVNYSRGHHFRDTPTWLFSTPLGTLHYVSNGGILSFSMDGLPGAGGLNDPVNWGWYGGSDLRLQQERRYTYTEGAHVNAAYGADKFKVQVGAAWDENYRLIRGYDNGNAFKNYGCGAGVDPFMQTPNSVSGCAITPTHSSYAGYGTGHTAGWPALQYLGPSLPQASIAQYLRPTKRGFVRADYAGLKDATDYNYFATNPSDGAPDNLLDPGRTNFSIGTRTNISSGVIDEKTYGFYGEIIGTIERGSQKLRYNLGARWVRTLQSLTGYTSVTDPRNANLSLADGARYPNYIVPATLHGSYSAFLPSANLVWQIFEDFQLRGAVSRTMTRANPAQMLPQLSGGGSDGQNWTLGNPNLRPFYSTNIDLGAELYTGGEGYIGVGIFKKMITGFQNNVTHQELFPYLAQFGITLDTTTGVMHDSIVNAATGAGCPDASCWVVNITQAQNATGLETIKGMEFTWVQPLDFLLEEYGLRGFGWVANATVISTKTTANSAAPSVVLNVSPLQYNLMGYYDNDGVMVRMSYNFTRGTITNSVAYGIISNRADFLAQYSQDYAVVDLSSSVKLSKFFGDLPTDPEVTFDVQNLFHAKNSGSYQQYTNVFNQIYDGGSLFMFGVRGSF